MSDFNKEICSARNEYLQAIIGLFQANNCDEYNFVNKIETGRPILQNLNAHSSLSVSETPGGKTLILKSAHVKGLDCLGLEDLLALYEHLSQWLSLFKMKRDLYSEIKSHIHPDYQGAYNIVLSGDAMFQDGKEYTYLLSHVVARDTDGPVPLSFYLTIYVPIFGYKDINIWEIKDEKLLAALQIHVQQKLEQKHPSISRIDDLENVYDEMTEIGRSLFYRS